MRIKILLCFSVLLLTYGSNVSYAEDTNPLDSKTMDRLRDAYNLEVPSPPPSILNKWSEGDWGAVLDPSILPDLFQAALHPAWFLTRHLVLILSS